MLEDFSYLSPEGHTVFTSYFLKKRGSCCRSACLHCPYGHTVKKLGIQFQSVTQEDEKLIREVLENSGQSEFDWEKYSIENIKFVIIKNVIIGVLFKNHIVIKHLFLKKHFNNQGLSRELVESYLYS